MTELYDPVEAAISDYLEAKRGGGNVAPLSHYAQLHDVPVEELETLLPLITAMESSKEPIITLPGESDLRQLGNFRIHREIGRGGMGVVFEAEDQSLNRTVALKVLPADRCTDAHARERFRREAQLAAALEHPNIVPIHALGQDRGWDFIAMRLIRGMAWDQLQHWLSLGARPQTTADGSVQLASLLQMQFDLHGPRDTNITREPAYQRCIAAMVAQIADAVQHAHEQGVLHRDIKPGNLLLDQDNRVWITDFGLAKSAQCSSLTASATLLGTPRYMAPEQFTGYTQAASDIYALGLSCYEMLSLQPAFQDRQPELLTRRIIEQGPPALDTQVPAIDPHLARIVHCAIARDPSQRYASAGAFRDDLSSWLEQRTPVLVPATTAVTAIEARPRRRLPMTILLLSLLVALGAALALWMRIPNQASPPQQAPSPPAPPPRMSPQEDFIWRLDRDGDQQISPEEFDGPPRRFGFHDRNGDGFISLEEAPLGPPPPRL